MNRVNPGRSSVFIDGTEMLGFIVYGLWYGVIEPARIIDGGSFRLGDAELREFRLTGENWTILGCDIGLGSLVAYRDAISNAEMILDCILARGACVAWMGYEGLPFADPPDLFTEEWMEGGVLAGKIAGGAFRSGIDTTTGHVPLDLSEMSELEAAAISCLRGNL